MKRPVTALAGFTLLVALFVGVVASRSSHSTVSAAPQVSCLGGTALPAPGGGNVFLRFLESFRFEDGATGDAYYRAVDPGNRRTTLQDWLVVNKFLQPGQAFGPGTGSNGTPGDTNIATDAKAIYLNAADLGFGRRMYLRRNANGALASYVENYGNDLRQINTDPVEGVDANGNPIRDVDVLENAKTRDANGLIATVCMEYVAPDDNPTGRKRVTFYTYNSQGQRISIQKLNLDGRGDKAQPGVCNVCHGGAPKALVNGIYPDKGDTKAYFLPWDVATFKFDTAPGFRRTDQEDQFRNLNDAVLVHHSQRAKLDETSGIIRPVAPVELIRGWYGIGTATRIPSGAVFDENFVPVGWRPSTALGIPNGADDVYREVMGPNCRACHIQRESSLDFATYKGFIKLRDATEDLVFRVPFKLAGTTVQGAPRPGDDKAVMPLALRTYNNFWKSAAPDKLCEFLATIPR